MTLVFNGDLLVGEYFYAKALRGIRLEGSVSDDRSFTLNEYDKSGVQVARFRGNFPEEDPREQFGPGSRLQCEVMIGVWEDVSSKRSYSFYLRLQYAVSAALGNRYARSMAIPNDEESIERLAQHFLAAVRANDREEVAKLVSYGTQIKNRKQLLADYDRIISETYKKDLERAIPKHMPMDRYGGIMLGHHGYPWICGDGKIGLFGCD